MGQGLPNLLACGRQLLWEENAPCSTHNAEAVERPARRRRQGWTGGLEMRQEQGKFELYTSAQAAKMIREVFKDWCPTLSST